MRNVAWYQEVDEYVRNASDLLMHCQSIFQDANIAAEIENFRELNIARLIFESNLIENAGLSYGETKKIIDESFPKIPSTYEGFCAMIHPKESLGDFLSRKKWMNAIQALKSNEKIIPSVSMKNKSRSWREVAQHYHAYLSTEIRMNKYWLSMIAYHCQRALGHPDTQESIKKTIEQWFKSIMDKGNVLTGWEDGPKLLDQDFIKNLHAELAKGLLPTDAKVPAGQYRIDNRIIGWDMTFPAPELIERAMASFVGEANQYVESFLSHKISIFDVAARISHKFVLIHPFPDFNGRVSRLLMNLILGTFNCPFPLAIKGDKKGRKRYFYSLKRANNGNTKILSGLIAKTMIDTLDELDKHLQLAKVETIKERRRELETTRSSDQGQALFVWDLISKLRL